MTAAASRTTEFAQIIGPLAQRFFGEPKARRRHDRDQCDENGAILQMSYVRGYPSWSLSSGRAVSVEVANILITNASVVPASDALFSDMPDKPGGTSNDD